jgi:hypothetical protein
MRTNYVLVDYENVQPKNLVLLTEDHFRIKVFLGSTLPKLQTKLVLEMQQLGNRAEFIQIDGNGKNALDFHIAYYIGQLATREPASFFHIISKDTGFDPLIAHLKSKGIFAKRSSSLDGIPILKALESADENQQVTAVIDKLKGMPKNRPQKESTLKTMINAWFGKNLDSSSLNQIVNELKSKKFISIDEKSKVTYSLPN